jgi:hypothetical protein
MHLQNQRLLKEARALLWPWCGVTLAGALGFVPGNFISAQFFAQGIAQMGFWFGIPLIATLSFGNEFQHQTFSMMLTQPIDRMEIWRDKMLVVLAAVVSAAGVYAIGYRNLLQWRGDFVVIPVIWVVITGCSAVVCSLIARSTVGGMILNYLHIVLIGIATVSANRFLGPEPSPEAVRLVLGLGVLAAVIYGILMLWIGRLMLARFQATGTASADLLVSTPDSLRDALSGFLRCSPDSPLSNLVLKEIRLLGPLWLLAILFSVLLICLAPLQWMPGKGVVQANVSYIAAFIVFLYGLISMLLAGCLSMGDERTLGTQLWHMTLPVSAGLQWVIKLSIAILSTFAGLVFVFTVGQLIFGLPFLDMIDEILGGHSLLHFFGLSSLSFPAFWCACAVRGTVRAALWTIPATAAILFVTRLGIGIAEGFGYSAPMLFVVSKIHSVRPMTEAGYGIWLDLTYGRFGFLWIVIPPTLVALFQSRLLFRREVPENSKSLVRALLWPVGVAFVLSFVLQLPRVFTLQSWFKGREILHSVFSNVEQLPLDLSQNDKTHPRQLTQTEVSAVLSPEARLWLDDPSMSMYKEPMVVRGTILPKKRTFLMAHLSNGIDCSVSNAIDQRTGREFAWNFVICADPNEGNSRFVRLGRWLQLNLR